MVSINIQKRDVLFLSVIIVFLVGISFIVAYGGNQPSVMGHSAGEIEGGVIPSGAVMFFNLTSCPPGWSELTSARGRYIVGLPLGGALGGIQGTALSNLENRATGGHYHYGAQGVRGIGASVTQIFPQGGSGSASSSVSNSGSDPGPNLPNLVNTVAGTNAPYIQLLACKKD